MLVQGLGEIVLQVKLKLAWRFCISERLEKAFVVTTVPNHLTADRTGYLMANSRIRL